MGTHRRKTFAWTIAVLIWLIGGIEIHRRYKKVDFLKDQLNWSEISCLVRNSSWEVASDRPGPNDRTWSVTFEYGIDGKVLHGTRARYNNNHFTSQEQDALSLTHAVGARVPCYSNPKNPSEVVLLRDPLAIKQYQFVEAWLPIIIVWIAFGGPLVGYLLSFLFIRKDGEPASSA